jgi:predicted N-acetyltransferase YhbS
MDLSFGTAQSLDCYRDALKLIDDEFVFGKGRSISLAERLPDAYGKTNSAGIFCALHNNFVIGTVVTKHIHVRIDQQSISGYMMGGIATKKDFRRQGVATQLYHYVEKMLARENFFVLWTGIPDFYYRMGWKKCGTGIFGEIQSPNSDSEADTCWTLAKINREKEFLIINALREQSGYATLLPENGMRYANLPLPVGNCDVVAARDENSDAKAYVAYGYLDDIAYVYELAGNDLALGYIMNDLCKRFSKVYVNAGQKFEQKIAKLTIKNVKPGSIMLIKSFLPVEFTYELNDLYFSYLERI